MDKQRCFFAIKAEPVDTYFNFLSKIRNEYDVKIKLVDPNNYHFTLHFFGDLSDQKISQVHQSFQSMEFNRFEFELKKTGSLPKNKTNRTRVLFISPESGKNKVEEIAKRVTDIVSLNDFEIPKRKFTPHLTICRIRSGNQIGDFTKRWLNTEFEPVKMECTKLSLLKSDLTSSGPLYTPLYEYTLKSG
ncbi:MAG: RNA 2',3'-cyclic phosphodiesterase [Candidatus Kariarchaeaceae archaeon]|jgi:2'-5' RNA ligase